MRPALAFKVSCCLSLVLVAGCSGSDFSGGGQTANPPQPVATPKPEPDDEDAVKVDTDLNAGKTTPAPTSPADDDVSLVLLPLNFERFPDTARNDNCLYIAINDQPEQLFGCSKSGAPQNSVTSQVRPQPHCNVVRLRLTTNGAPAWTTQNAAAISQYFRFTKLAPGQISLQANDNGDQDFNDLNVTISGGGAVNFTIENAPMSCD